MIVPGRLRGLRLAAALLLCGLSVVSAPSLAQTTARTVHGQVINALSGAGIARALVTMNTRSVLTDSQGRFEFPQFADTSATVMAVRPGFASGAGAPMVPRRVTDLDSAVVVRMYPDALVSGVVTGSDELPLGQVEVLLRRANAGQGPRWLVQATAMTNVRGEYRLQAPAGTFRLSVAYRARLRETGETLSPMSYPDTAVDSAQAGFALGPGEERRIDLRARTGAAYPVTITVEQAEARDGQRGGMRFTVSQPDGESFSPNSQGTGVPGEYRLSLPAGSYTLHAHSEARDDSMDGVAKINVAGHAVSGVVMRMAPLTAIGVEVTAAPGTVRAASGTLADTSAAPDARQLNLRLSRISDTVNENYGVDTSLRQRPDKSFEFRVPAGRYRLEGFGQGTWFVTSATYGVTDVLTSELLVGPGGGGQVIRVLASNEHGRVRGRVAGAGGREDLWVYLLPQQPALSVPGAFGVAADGTFQAWVPVGSYAAVAVEGQLQQNLRDPEVLARLATDATTVKVLKDAETAVNLDLAAAGEVKP